MVGVAPTAITLFRDHVSLMHGWVPLTAQILAAVLLVLAIGWRTRRWRLMWVPAAALLGIGLAWLTYWIIASNGLSGEPAPGQLWVWVAITGLAVGVAALGWRSARRWRRGASLLAVPMSALCAGLMLNLWVGYFPTVQTAWGQVTGGPLPGQTDHATVAKMVAAQAVPAKGKLLTINTPSTASKLKHRGELVYLPPAYFSSNPPPVLPTVMMIGGQFNTPADWIRIANAATTIDEFADRNDGWAPVFVFADSGGAFNNDTECVDGVRGNAATHLTEDVVPYMEANFGVSDNPANWGVVGWSSGGTCALNLTVKYPDVFSAFVNIDGDLYPNAGTKAQTISRLYGGNAAAFDDWDPAVVMERHGPYEGVAGWFAVSEPAGSKAVAISGVALEQEPPETNAETNTTAAARTLCGLASTYGIDCAVVPQTGKHDWPFAARAFASSLPWLAAQIGTPVVPDVGLPGTSSQPDGVTIAAEAGTRPLPAHKPAGVR
ncbi:MAG: alpha/beta hydrolase-fold protein [Mycobacterium sp.]